MRLYKCDRCQEQTEVIREISYTRMLLGFILPIDINKELCIKCFTEFRQWIDNDTFVLSKRTYNPEDKTIRFT